MGELELRAWAMAVDMIHAVAQIEDLDDFGPTVLTAVDGLVPSDISSFNEIDPVAGRAVVVGRPRPVTADELGTWARWSHQNPMLMHAMRTGDGSARRMSDFLTADELHRLELYRDVYGPLGVEYQVAVTLPAPQPLVIGIALNRSRVDFTDNEVALLDILRPHLVQAYRRLQALAEHRRTLEAVAGVLEGEGRAFHILGAPLAGPSGALLASYFGAGAGDLPDPVRTWLTAERAAVADRPAGRLNEPLVRERDGRRLTVRFVPGGEGPDLLWLDERTSESDARPLQSLGLSEREAEVLWLLTKGTSTGGIAAELGVSSGTVKKHLEHVFRKLGVSTRTAAVAQAFDAMAAR